MSLDYRTEAPGVGWPSGVIGSWHGTIANIPVGFFACDGNNGTPNMLGRFAESVPNLGTDPGATGGATAKTTSGHTHTVDAHAHESPWAIPAGGAGNVKTADPSVYGTGESQTVDEQYARTGVASDSHAMALTKAVAPNTDSKTDGIADIRPLFYDVAFIMKS